MSYIERAIMPVLKNNMRGKDMSGENELLENLDKLHTTELGIERIRRNLSLDVEDVVKWCQEQVSSAQAEISRKGKNWYVRVDGCVITVNAYSYTIITAHSI